MGVMLGVTPCWKVGHYWKRGFGTTYCQACGKERRGQLPTPTPQRTRA